MKLKKFTLNLIALLLLASVKISAQNDFVRVTVAEIKKANAAKARLDSAHAMGRLVLKELAETRDTVNMFKDSTAKYKGLYFISEQKAKGYKKERNLSLAGNLIQAVLNFIKFR